MPEEDPSIEEAHLCSTTLGPPSKQSRLASDGLELWQIDRCSLANDGPVDPPFPALGSTWNQSLRWVARESRQPRFECPSQTEEEEESVDSLPTRAGVEPPRSGDASEFLPACEHTPELWCCRRTPRPRELALKVLKAQANGPQLPEIDRQTDLL